MKKIICKILPLAICASMFTACGSEKDSASDETTAAESSVEFNIASLKGPTTMGMVKLMSDSEKGLTTDKYNVTIYGTADEIVTGLVSGSVDVANIPANLSSVLYKKTDGGISAAAINTLGVLYMVETGNTISTVSDLKGKTIYSTGKGTTPEYVLNYILTQNGINPQTDVTIEYKSESTEIASILAESDNAIALLPQPYVSVASIQNDKIRICLDMTVEWNKISAETLVTGVVVGRNDFIEQNNEAFYKFLDRYENSTKFVNANNAEASELIEKYDIVKKEPALKALPYCNITFIRDDDMKKAMSNYLTVLFEQDPASVGGAVPDEKFYYQW